MFDARRFKHCRSCGAEVTYLVPPDDSRERAVCSRCREIHYDNPINVVGTVPVWNDRVLLCERGSSFGYNNLVVDMLGIDLMKPMAPVIFDVTHALQRPGGRADSADGRGPQAAALARAGIAVGIAGLFLEAHPDPAQARCDGPCALRLDQLEPFLRQLTAIDAVVKGCLA